jgi:hypothetical protein
LSQPAKTAHRTMATYRRLRTRRSIGESFYGGETGS